MLEVLIEMANRLFPEKEILTPDEVARILDCDPKVIYHWVKRSDPSKRPPRLIIGQDVRYPKLPLMKWIAENQGR